MKISVVLLKSFLNRNSKKPSKNLRSNKCLPTAVTRTSHFLYRYFKLRDIMKSKSPKRVKQLNQEKQMKLQFSAQKQFSAKLEVQTQ